MIELTIDEVIEHCNKTCEQMERFAVASNQEIISKSYSEHYQVSEWLKKLKGYEKIGLTPQQLMEVDKLYLEKCEEVNKLNEKQIPKKPTWVLHQGKGNNYQKCPNCDEKWLYLNQDYCEFCGQAIDWSVEV